MLCIRTRIPGCSVHQVQENGAKEVTQRHGSPQEACGDGLQWRRRLLVEELEQPNIGEHVGYAKDKVLKRQPEGADGQGWFKDRNGLQHTIAPRSPCPYAQPRWVRRRPWTWRWLKIPVCAYPIIIPYNCWARRRRQTPSLLHHRCKIWAASNRRTSTYASSPPGPRRTGRHPP